MPGKKLVCPVPASKRTVGYVHGWNKACDHSSECLPYPAGYTGVRFGAKGAVLGVVKEKRKALRKPRAPLPKQEEYIDPSLLEESEGYLQAPRSKGETREQKLARARAKMGLGL